MDNIVLWAVTILVSFALYVLLSGVAFISVYRFPESGGSQFYGWFFKPLDWVARRVPLFGGAYNGYHQWCYRNFVANDHET
jgi:hypothetical protein